ncbi:MAG: S53 family peptidase [Sphingomonadales bacterium]|jgi:subtilase family serine protease
MSILRLWALLAVMAGLAAGLSAPVRAEEPVERSGNEYHRAVCARAVLPGEARCMAHVRTDARGGMIIGRPNAAAQAISGFQPTDLRRAYNVTASGSSATIVAIVDAYGYANAEADLAVYRAATGLPPCTSASGCFIMIDQYGGKSYPRYNAGWAQEQALDLDMVSAMCPNCRIMLVQAKSASFADLAAATNRAAASGARVISNSYSGGESGSTAYASAYNHPGIAITASSGDSGFAGGTGFPATSPGVIAVGGTSLVRAANTRGFSETVWKGAGSGCSTTYAKPAWQTDTGCARRMETDISAVADPATGVAVYGPTGQGTASGWLVFGGTSVSAPLIGGIYGALGVGAANGASKIWATAATRTGFNDVTQGNNGTCSLAYFCTAVVGYDGPTGWGSPYGAAPF